MHGAGRDNRALGTRRVAGIGHHHLQHLAFVGLGRRVGRVGRPENVGPARAVEDLPLVSGAQVNIGPVVGHGRHGYSGSLDRVGTGQSGERRRKIAGRDLLHGAGGDNRALAARRIAGIGHHDLQHLAFVGLGRRVGCVGRPGNVDPARAVEDLPLVSGTQVNIGSAVGHRRHADGRALNRVGAGQSAERRQQIAGRDLLHGAGRGNSTLTTRRVTGIGHHHPQCLAFVGLDRRVGCVRCPGNIVPGRAVEDLPLVGSVRQNIRSGVRHRRHADGRVLECVAAGQSAERRQQIAPGDLLHGAGGDSRALGARRICGIGHHQPQCLAFVGLARRVARRGADRRPGRAVENLPLVRGARQDIGSVIGHRRHADRRALYRVVTGQSAERRHKIAGRGLLHGAGGNRIALGSCPIAGIGHHQAKRFAFVRLGRRVAGGGAEPASSRFR